MLQDLHSHTYYSFCGKDTPEAIVEAAIAGGLDTFGITDHNYGIGYARHSVFCATASMELDNYERTLARYYDHISCNDLPLDAARPHESQARRKRVQDQYH